VESWIVSEELRLQQQHEAREKAIKAEQQAKDYRKAAGDTIVIHDKLTNKKRDRSKPNPIK
jgi:hypothetical protein